MDNLPAELHQLVIDFFPLKLRPKLEIVCRLWQKLAFKVQAFSLADAAPQSRFYEAFTTLLRRSEMFEQLRAFKIKHCGLSTVATPLLPLLASARNLAVVEWENVLFAGEMIATLLKAAPPLRKLTVSTCARIAPELLVDLPNVVKTLRHLVLFEDAPLPETEDREAFLQSIAATFGDSLEVLGVTSNTWASLRPMKALRELYIICQGQIIDNWLFQADLGAMIARHRAELPPGVGLHLVLGQEIGMFHSLLTAANAQEAALLVTEGFSLNHPLMAKLSRTAHLNQLLLDLQGKGGHDWEPEGFEIIGKLLEIAPDSVNFLGKVAGQLVDFFTWAFTAAHVSQLDYIFTKKFNGKTFLENWVEREPKQITGKIKPGFPLARTRQALQSSLALSRAIHSGRDLKQRLQFARDHPDIFGEFNPNNRVSGLTMLNICTTAEQARVLLEMGADFRQRNGQGYDAIQFAFLRASPTLPGLLLGLSDTLLRRYATAPRLWAGLTPSDATQQCLERMCEVSPNSASRPVAYTLHAVLRNPTHFEAGLRMIAGLLHEGEDSQWAGKIREVVVEALMEKLDPDLLLVHRVDEPFILGVPLPHVLVRPCIETRIHIVPLCTILRQMAATKPDELRKWLGQTDSYGLTAKIELRRHISRISRDKAEEVSTKEWETLYESLGGFKLEWRPPVVTPRTDFDVCGKKDTKCSIS